MPSIINSDDGVVSGTSGLKTTGGNDGILSIQNNGTTNVTVTAAGNVGIGTSSPSSRLDVRTSAAEIGRFSSSATNGGYQIFYPDNVTTPVYVGSLKAILATGNATDFAIVGTGANNMVFGTNSVERARITDGGDLLIGISTRTSLEKVNITHNGASQEGLIIVNTNTAAGTHTAIGFRRPSGTQVGQITTTLSATAYVTSSDYRLKENVQQMTGALAKVAALKPCTYTWKSTGEASQGFIAHELQEVVPECVSGEKDAVNEDGSIKPQGIDTSFLVATLTAAIQEQQQMIETLQAEVAELKARV